MRLDIDHSEGGKCNSYFSKSIAGVGLNTSGGIQGRATIFCSYKVSP